MSVILGDTYNSDRMLSIGSGADLLVHEATLSEEDVGHAKTRGHSTASMASKFAAALGAKALALTHFSGAFEISEAEKMSRVVKQHYGGPFFFAEDFLSVAIWPGDRSAPNNPGEFVVTESSEQGFLRDILTGKSATSAARNPAQSILSAGVFPPKEAAS